MAILLAFHRHIQQIFNRNNFEALKLKSTEILDFLSIWQHGNVAEQHRRIAHVTCGGRRPFIGTGVGSPMLSDADREVYLWAVLPNVSFYPDFDR